MTNFLHWRKMTWTFVLWSAAMIAWPLIGSAGAVLAGLLWFAGMFCLYVLWHATQPPFRQGRGFGGLLVWPGPGHWRVVNLHHAFWATEPRRNAD